MVGYRNGYNCTVSNTVVPEMACGFESHPNRFILRFSQVVKASVFDTERRRFKSVNRSLKMACWLNWYSTWLEAKQDEVILVV